MLTVYLLIYKVYSEMATIQKRKSHGQTYWYIVESRRVNGKPRPITLEYLGKAEDLLERIFRKQLSLIYCRHDNYVYFDSFM